MSNFMNIFMINTWVIDSRNYLLLILLIYIMLIRLISRRFLIKFNASYIQILITIILVLTLFFLSSSLLKFYLFFEFSILPIFIIIMG